MATRPLPSALAAGGVGHVGVAVVHGFDDRARVRRGDLAVRRGAVDLGACVCRRRVVVAPSGIPGALGVRGGQGGVRCAAGRGEEHAEREEPLHAAQFLAPRGAPRVSRLGGSVPALGHAPPLLTADRRSRPTPRARAARVPWARRAALDPPERSPSRARARLALPGSTSERRQAPTGARPLTRAATGGPAGQAERREVGPWAAYAVVMRSWLLLSIPLFAMGCGSSPTTPLPDGGDDAGAADATIGTDGASDGASPDAPGDAPTDAGDAGPGATPIVCGQTVCRIDQTCTAGKCTFPCTGYTVPGDYATVQAAIDGLAAAGNDATICLGEKTYAEGYLYVRDPAKHGKALRIVGPSMDRAKITAYGYWLGGWSSLTMQGVHLDGTTADALKADFGTSPGKISLVASRFSGQSGVEVSDNYGQTGELFVDGCDFPVGGGYAVQAFTISASNFKVTVQNSVMRGCGCAANAGATAQGTLDFRFVDNTVVGCGMGLWLEEAGNLTGHYANSIFTGANAVAIRRDNAGTKVTHANNALWANAANYQGTADGAGYVKTDCLLDQAGPAPTLELGSPCRGAGDLASAPALDFFAVPRGSPADIGATRAY